MSFDRINRKCWLVVGLFITVHVAFASNTPPITNGATAYWGACTPAHPISNYQFTPAAPDGTVAGLNLRLDSVDSQSGSLWVYDCNAVSLSTSDTARIIALLIPIDLTGWTWWDGPSSSRTITAGQKYQSLNSDSLSPYPMAVASNGTSAICISVPLEPARPVRFVYDGVYNLLRAEFDFGFSPISTNFPNCADARVYIYEVPAEQAFRQALDHYYDIHQDLLVRRAGIGGTHLTKTDLSTISNPSDFHFAWHDFAENVQDWADYDQTLGVQSFLYEEPQSEWRRLRPSFSGTTHTDFDDGTPGTLIPSGAVTYSGGRAYIPANCGLIIPGPFPTSSSENIVLEFTLHNLDQILLRQDSYAFGWFGKLLCGLKKSSETGDVLRVGAFDYAASYRQDGEAVTGLGSQKVTVKMVASSASANITYVFAGYDSDARDGTTEGNLHFVGKYYWGGWTADSGLSQISLFNYCWTTLVVDDVIVTRYSGYPIPEKTYQNFHDQLIEDAQMGVLAAQPSVVSGIYTKDDELGFYLADVVWSDGYQPLTVNVDPGNHPASYPQWDTKSDYIRALLSEVLGWDGNSNNMDGLFHDSVDWGGLDYNIEHWAVSSYPLFFDRSNNYAVCVFNKLATVKNIYSYMDDFKAHNQLIMGNTPFGAEASGTQQWFPMGCIDISGRETPIYDASDNWSPPSNDAFLHWRACAARRPYWVMWNDTYENGDDINKCMELCMFYGMFPTMFHAHDGVSPGYWATPDFYNRDRDLFNAYVPVIQDIDMAGWEPVTHATVNSGCYIERWGASTGDLYFTVYNPSPAIGGTVQVDLQGNKLGLHEQIKVTPQIDTANAITILNAGTATPSLQFWIGPQSCRVIKLETFIKGDINTDGSVNVLDFLYLAEYWLQTDPPVGDLVEDNIIDLQDFAQLAEVWLEPSIP